VLTGCAFLRERPTMSITEIATRSGFYDHAAFTHAFLDSLGITPTQFRAEPFAFYERERAVAVSS
jgi:AraC-like DNA-binding protein